MKRMKRYCECGCPVEAELVQVRDEYHYKPVFWVPDVNDPNHPVTRQEERCPDCGEELTLFDLRFEGEKE